MLTESNPGDDASMKRVLAGKGANWKIPAWFAFVVSTRSSEKSVTSAPVTGAPEGSRTVPFSLAPDWP
jgi:hypothetical protein